MANLDKLKQKRNRLGDPPSAAEASTNIFAPEVAPAAELAPAAPEGEGVSALVTELRPVQRRTRTPSAEAAPAERLIDGRSLRRTGRTVAFATRVSANFHQELRKIAHRDKKLIVEVLEEALRAYETARRQH